VARAATQQPGFQQCSRTQQHGGAAPIEPPVPGGEGKEPKSTAFYHEGHLFPGSSHSTSRRLYQRPGHLSFCGQKPPRHCTTPLVRNKLSKGRAAILPPKVR